MRYDYIGPFLSTTLKVLDNVIQSDISRGDLSLVEEELTKDGVNIVIELEGDSDGRITLNMDEGTAAKISGAMGAEGGLPLSDIHLDAVSELANMIAGNATSALNDLGFNFNVAPPLVITGNAKAYKKLPGMEAFQVPIFTDCGEITVNFSVRTN